VPVILLSARAGEESRVEGLQAGADDYLVKPFSARELLARVGAHIEMDRLRKEAAQREHALLAEAESAAQRLEAVLESISDGFIALDRDWLYTAVNNQACESMGMRRAKVLGRPIWELYPDTVGTPFEFELRRAVAEQQTVVFEYCYPTRNRWYENRLYPSADGLSIFFAEVTERKQAEAALRASEAALRRAHDELEARVVERTAELARANALLRREAAERQRAELAGTELLRRLVTAQEDERRRVAHDIHDGVTQLTAAAALHVDEALSLATGLDDDPRHELDRARDLARQATAESRRLIAGLRPAALDDFGLVGVLRQEVDALQEAGWSATIKLDHTAHSRFGPEVEITLYRVAQEALLNIRKHTEHVRVRVRLRRVDDEVRLEVRDWGQGFDLKRAREGAAAGERVGVAGMRERLVLIGGRLEVQSTRGRGTTIRATVPLPTIE
jgi:PAS domain S-box-containing protein